MVKDNLFIFRDRIDDKDNRWPIITDAERDAVVNCLDEGEISYYSNDRKIRELEAKFSLYHKRKYALAVNSGTSALFIAYLCCGLCEEDEVLVPNYTFPATVLPLLHIKCKPILVDCEYGLPFPSAIEYAKKITKKTKVMVVTHMDGLPAKSVQLRKLASEHNLLLIEDVAQSLGAVRDGESAGYFGDISIFSLTNKKIVVGGEGGVLLTDNREIYEKAILYSYLQKRSYEEISQGDLQSYCYTGLGFNFRIHPFSAAMACVQFDKFPSEISRRREFENWLTKILLRFDFIEPILPDSNVLKGQYSIKYKVSLSSDAIDRLVIAANEAGIPIERTTTKLLSQTAIFSVGSHSFKVANGLNTNFCFNENETFPNSQDYILSTIRLPALYSAEQKFREKLERSIVTVFGGNYG